MSKYISILITGLLLISTSLAASQGARKNSAPKDIDKVGVVVGYIPSDKPSIISPCGQGSIIIWKGQKYILTCAHVIAAASFWGHYSNYDEIKFIVRNKTNRSEARLIYIDSKNRDLALLEVEDNTFYDGVIPLEVETDNPNRGDIVYNLLSSPLSSIRSTIWDGSILIKGNILKQNKMHSGIDKMGNQLSTKVDMISCDSYPGYSGSVVISEQGKVIGILSAGECFSFSEYSESLKSGGRTVNASIVAFSELQDFLNNIPKEQ